MDLYQVMKDISQTTTNLDSSIKSILLSIEKQQESLASQIQNIENHNFSQISIACIKDQIQPQTPKSQKTIDSKSQNSQQKKQANTNETQQSMQQNEQQLFLKQQNTFIQKQQELRKNYLESLKNEQKQQNQNYQLFTKQCLQFKVLKQQIINYKNSLFVQQLEKDLKKGQNSVYFVEEDLQQISRITFNYVDIFNLQQQVFQVCQNNIQLFEKTTNQLQQYQNYLAMENQRKEQERIKEHQRQQEEFLKEKLKQEQELFEKQKQLEFEQLEQQRQKQDVIKQQLERISEQSKSQKIQIVQDEYDNSSDTQEICNECNNCGQAISEDNVQLNCFHSYHLLCLIQRIMSQPATCVMCFCNQAIPFKIINQVLLSNPQYSEYSEEFLKNTIQTIIVNSQLHYTICKCNFIYISPENGQVDQCSECSTE